MAIKTPKNTLIDITQDPGLVRTKVASAKSRRPEGEDLQQIIEKYSLPLLHWAKDKPDSRDYLYKSVPVRTPNTVDLRPWCTPIEDQGRLGSCVGQAVAGSIEYLNRRAGKSTDVSRLFIYYYSRVLINTVNWDSGAYIRDGIKVVYRNGAPTENLWPYLIQKFTQRPSTRAISDALRRTITLYERITTLDGCINALANGLPIIVGFNVYSSFLSNAVRTTGVMPYPNVYREPFMGGHAVLLVGYNSTTRRFIARNSWGSSWGDRGYFYMPYEVIANRSMSDDFWVIRNVKNP